MSTAAYRALSWTWLAAILAFVAWATVAPNGFPGAPVVAVLTVCATFAALRLGRKNAPPYWQSAAEPVQAPRVVWLIVASLVVQTAGLALVTWVPQLTGVSYRAVSDVVWTAVLMIGLAGGYVKWPKRVARPSRRELFVVSAIAGIVATGISLAFVASAVGPDRVPSVSGFASVLPAVFYGALLEEVFFRVLLLTALVLVTRSSGPALVLSSVAFALAHIPGTFAQPVLEMDQTFLIEVLKAYVPQFTWQLGVGFALGALWIRTGSISLIAVTHAIFNLGPTWAYGL